MDTGQELEGGTGREPVADTEVETAAVAGTEADTVVGTGVAASAGPYSVGP